MKCAPQQAQNAFTSHRATRTHTHDTYDLSAYRQKDSQTDRQTKWNSTRSIVNSIEKIFYNCLKSSKFMPIYLYIYVSVCGLLDLFDGLLVYVWLKAKTHTALIYCTYLILFHYTFSTRCSFFVVALRFVFQINFTCPA